MGVCMDECVKQELRGNIRVFVRVRPFLPSDGVDGMCVCVRARARFRFFFCFIFLISYLCRKPHHHVHRHFFFYLDVAAQPIKFAADAQSLKVRHMNLFVSSSICITACSLDLTY